MHNDDKPPIPDLQISAGGLAIDGNGSLRDMPRDLAHTISGDLLDVVTLLHASMREVGGLAEGSVDDDDDMTSQSSRAVSLVAMADDKVRSVLEAISPYV